MMPYGVEARNSTKVSFSLDGENFIYFARSVKVRLQLLKGFISYISYFLKLLIKEKSLEID